VKFLILTADYSAFIAWFYAQHAGLELKPYAEQMQMRSETLYNESFFYSDNLKKLGHEAYDIYVNNEYMQKTWAREHGFRFREDGRWEFRLRRGIVPWVSRINGRWLYDILAAQIRHYKPDVLFNQALDTIDCGFLREIKPHVGVLIGQHAATQLPNDVDFSSYDLVISSFPPTVESFREKGIPAELHRIGFGQECLSCMDGGERPFDITFIGSLVFPLYASRVALLEALCSRFPQLKVWGPAPDHLEPTSPIRNCYQGEAWGREMYRVFARSKITLNHHGDILPYANNCRLYEATGMGALLMTDWKENLHEMFEPGKHVVAYRSPDECVELMQYYLGHQNEREAIARAGQEHTLRKHTYDRRSEELIDIVGKYL